MALTNTGIPHHLYCPGCAKVVETETWLKAEKAAKAHWKKKGKSKKHRAVILVKVDMQPWYGGKNKS